MTSNTLFTLEAQLTAYLLELGNGGHVRVKRIAPGYVVNRGGEIRADIEASHPRFPSKGTAIHDRTDRSQVDILLHTGTLEMHIVTQDREGKTHSGDELVQWMLEDIKYYLYVATGGDCELDDSDEDLD